MRTVLLLSIAAFFQGLSMGREWYQCLLGLIAFNIMAFMILVKS